MVNVHFQHGMALRDLGRYDEAIKEFELARIESPDHAETVIMMAWCHYSLGSYQQSLNIAKSAAAMEPENDRALTLMGASEIALNHYKVAQGYLRNAIVLNPQSAYAHYLLGFAFGQKRVWREALKEIDEAIRLSPESADYISYKSYILLMLGRKEEAKSTSHVALRLTPEDSRTHSQHGQILLAEGKIDEAIQHYREAVRNNPRDIWLQHEYIEAARGRMWLFRLFLSCRMWLQRQSVWISLFALLFPLCMLPIGIIAYNNHLVGDKFMEVLVMLFLIYIGFLIFVPTIMDGLTSLDSELKLIFPPTKRKKSIAVLFIFVISLFCFLVGLIVHVAECNGISIVGLVCLVFLCVDERAFPTRKWP
jgi:tetratricopeptide (TPR) repeat protein